MSAHAAATTQRERAARTRTTGGVQWREGVVTGGATRFHVRAIGRGDDVVMLLHGWPQDGTAWRRVAPLLADAGHRVVVPDLKGLGRSEKPGRGYDPETLADEISDLVRNLHAERVVLVGHDWGGAIALATAFRHPDRVRGLVMVSSPYRQLDLRSSFHVPLFNLPVVPELAFRLFPRQLVGAALHHFAEIDEGFDDDVVEHYATGVAADPAAWLAYYRTLSRRAVVDWGIRRLRRALPLLHERTRSGGRERVPALVVWGDRDRGMPYHLAPRVAWDLGAQLVTLEGVGHFTPEEDPLGLTRAVLAFISRLDRDEARASHG